MIAGYYVSGAEVEEFKACPECAHFLDDIKEQERETIYQLDEFDHTIYCDQCGAMLDVTYTDEEDE